LKNNLILFYRVQIIDKNIDKLEEQRGDLPLVVDALESKLVDLKSAIEEKIDLKNESVEKKEANAVKIKELLDNQKRAKSQLYKVRNNKEYDTITKSIDASDAECTRLEKESDAMIDNIRMLDSEIQALTPLVLDLEAELDHKNQELENIKENNSNEEQKLLKQREAYVAQMKKSDYSLYTRVRAAKKGLGVAKIRRNACSGCQTVIPSQRQLEIRRNNKMFTCEYCGRIIVSAEVASDAGELED
jgi:predicted  nucleic acid-binding Zn-ribbon protein